MIHNQEEKVIPITDVDALHTVTELLEANEFSRAEELLDSLSDTQRTRALSRIASELQQRLVVGLNAEDAAEYLHEMPEVQALEILSEMETNDATVVRKLITYDDDDAGGIMAVKFLAVSESETVAQVIDHIRDNVEEFSDYDVQYAYVTDSQKHLKGVLRLRDLLVSRDNVGIESIMIRDPLMVTTHTKLPELHTIFDSHSFIGIPVINHLD